MAFDYLLRNQNTEKQKNVFIQTKITIGEFGNLSTIFDDEKHTQYEHFTTSIARSVSYELSVDLFEQSNPLNDNEKWFEDLAKGRQTKLPKLSNKRNQDDISEKQELYQRLLPTYIALRQDYKSRSIFQWIFNHQEYVAVRDSYRALENLIKNVTGDKQRDLDAERKQYETQVKLPTAQEIRDIKREIDLRRQQEENQQELDEETERDIDKQSEINDNLQIDKTTTTNNKENKIFDSPNNNLEESTSKTESTRTKISKEELERYEKESAEAKELNGKGKTPYDRVMALNSNNVYTKEIKDFLKEQISYLRNNDEVKLEQFYNELISSINHSENEINMCKAIFDNVCTFYVSDDVNPDTIVGMQVVTDKIVNKLVCPNDPQKQSAYQGLSLKNKRDLNIYFNVDLETIQAAKNEYQYQLNELYMVDLNNPMEIQARKEDELNDNKETVEIDQEEEMNDRSSFIDDDDIFFEEEASIDMTN